jgi:hypothetical protein
LLNDEEFRQELKQREYETILKIAETTGETVELNRLSTAQAKEVSLAASKRRGEIQQENIELAQNYEELSAIVSSQERLNELKSQGMDFNLAQGIIAAEADIQNIDERLAILQNYGEQDAFTQSQINELLLDRKEAVKQLSDKIRDAQISELDHRKAMGEFDKDEKAYYDEKINILKQTLQNRIEEGIIGSENWAIQEEIYNLEQQRNDLIKERLGLQDKELNNLISQHQQLLRTHRADGGKLTPEQSRQLQALEKGMENRLQDLGVSEDEIDKIMMELKKQRKSYQKGGWVKEPIAQVEYGEFVIPSDQASEIEAYWPGLLKDLQQTKGQLPKVLSDMLEYSFYLEYSIKELKMEIQNDMDFHQEITNNITIQTQNTKPEDHANTVIKLIEKYMRNNRFNPPKTR